MCVPSKNNRIDLILQTGFLSILVKSLSCPASETELFDVAWIITNISIGTTKHCTAILDHNLHIG